jgi:molybdenum cofactor cytidylyltransferase/nicotine blue oxidoreductase
VTVRGLLLAAGAGSRMGVPKALVDDWLVRGVSALGEGGCDGVTVVLGAGADRARELLAGVAADVVVADDWAEGMGASLRAGLAGLDADAVLVSLVDLPDVDAEVVRRVLGEGAGERAGAATLRRATYDGRPGHPVLIGRDHWAGVAGAAVGDRGARDYLATHAVESVECGDLATGRDVDG